MTKEKWEKHTCNNCGTEVVDDPDRYWDGEDDALYTWLFLTGADENAHPPMASDKHFCSRACLKTWVAEL